MASIEVHLTDNETVTVDNVTHVEVINNAWLVLLNQDAPIGERTLAKFSTFCLRYYLLKQEIDG